ncbi:MAG: MarR family transcriptional regulator [Actinomycetota bacterium]
MSDRPSSSDEALWSVDALSAVEADVRALLDARLPEGSGAEIDIPSFQAISNIYRAAAAVRRRAEREVLSAHGLTWGGFTALWVLWVWGPMETARLAAECDLAKGTLTGLVTTLEKRSLVTRERVSSDRRRVVVALTERGTATIEEVYPRFNAFEVAMSDGLSDDEKRTLAASLRTVITNADDPSSDS